jgi:hypothetical protein
MGRSRVFVTGLLVTAVCLLATFPIAAGSTTKSLSTNFTLVNLGDAGATGTVEYFQPDGSAWGWGSENFTIPEPGGQLQFRQYFGTDQPGNPGLTDGSGSVVVYADQPLGAVVQIQARGQNPTTMGAYSGVSAGSGAFYVPLVARMLNTASGLANSQIIAQNTGVEAVNVAFALISGANGSTTHTHNATIQAGAAYTYDLADEIASNVPSNWFGSAVVSVVGTGEIAVVSNFFTGHAMQTFNGFPTSDAGTKWNVPLFTSRLENSLSTVISVQNVSTSTIPVDGLTVMVYPDASLGAAPFELRNKTAIPPSGAYYFNPVVDTSIPARIYGAAVVVAPEGIDIVTFVQMRFINQGEAAAYEAISDGTGGSQVTVPLVAKRLSNGFASVVTIQNLSDQVATVNLKYIPGSSSFSEVNITGVTIEPGRSFLQNHRVYVPELPSGWYGSLVITSNQDVHAFVQLTFLPSINPGVPSGDNFMAHTAFAQTLVD